MYFFVKIQPSYKKRNKLLFLKNKNQPNFLLPLEINFNLIFTLWNDTQPNGTANACTKTWK